MKIKNTSKKYGIIAIFLHWLMAVMILSLICLGLYIAETPFTPYQLKLFGYHKAFGIVVLGLVMLRILWRLININPTLPDNISKQVKLMAHLGHLVLYALMILMPLSGWMMSSAAGFPVSFFGIFTLPDLISPNPDLKKIFSIIHEFSGYALIATIVGHSFVALLHHFYYKDNILKRML